MKSFLEKYIDDFTSLVISSQEIVKELLLLKDFLVSASDNGNKSIIVGNGGSAAIASHFSVDLTKNAGIRCINFNESDLITCFSNDYGYEHWLEKAVEMYGNKGDVLIGISSSGTSKNILNACRAAREMNFSEIITLSGMHADNPLKKLGDINLWVNSNAYNHIENMHQFWLLAVVDLVIGKAEYSANQDEH